MDWWARAFGLIGIAVSIAGLAIGYAQYRHSRPRLRITAQNSIVLGLGEDRRQMRSCVVVTVANDGGVDVRINSVDLSGPGGLNGDLVSGPDLPIDLSAHGGSSTWLFDYHALRKQLGERIRTEMSEGAPARVQAVVRTGSKVLAPAAAAVYVNPPGVSTHHPEKVSVRRRFSGWRRTWSRPVPRLGPNTLVSPTSFGERQSILTVSNGYRRTAEPCALVLTVKHADGTRAPIPGRPAIDVPRIRGRQSVEVAVPFVDGSAAEPGDEFDWILKTHAGFGTQPAGATLLADVQQLKGRLDEARERQSLEDS